VWNGYCLWNWYICEIKKMIFFGIGILELVFWNQYPGISNLCVVFQLLCQEREINELREQNLCLQDNVGHLALQSTSDLTLDTCPNSLFRELRVFNTKSTSTESLDTDVFSQKSVNVSCNG